MDSVTWQQTQAHQAWSPHKQETLAVVEGLAQHPQQPGDLEAKLAHGSALERKHTHQGAGRHCMDSSQEAHLIKAFQGHACTPAAEAASTSPNSLHRRQQEWLDQKVAAKPNQTPTLPEVHLQLPASAFDLYSDAGMPSTTCEPMDEDATPLAILENHGSSPHVDAQQAREDVEADVPAPSVPLRSFVHQASSIKPRERREPERYGSKAAMLKASSSMPSFSRRSSTCSGQSDGVMMLLQACEALDSRRVISPISSYSPSRPPRPRTGVSDLERIRASFSRAHSDSLLGSRGSACSGSTAVHKREKENAASVAVPAKKTAVAKPAKARRGRSELHGPCCHCLATDSPQWRKGPKCKPILCNACGTRFLRTRSLGKSMGKTSSKKLSFSSSASSCNNDDSAALSELIQEEEMGDDTLGPFTTSKDELAAPAHYHQVLAGHAL